MGHDRQAFSGFQAPGQSGQSDYQELERWFLPDLTRDFPPGWCWACNVWLNLLPEDYRMRAPSQKGHCTVTTLSGGTVP